MPLPKAKTGISVAGFPGCGLMQIKDRPAPGRAMRAKSPALPREGVG